MSNVAIVYWSGTGNTEAMAQLVAEGATGAGAEVTLVQASDFGAGDVAGYDALAFGCPAMGDEELEDMEFEPMYDAVEPELGAKKVVLFGSFSWNEGAWMDTWSERAAAAGVNVVATVIARDYPQGDAADACTAAGAALA